VHQILATPLYADHSLLRCYITISMLWGNMAYGVKLSNEDVLRYANNM